MDTLLSIGTVIKKHRKEKNLTQEEVAKRLGVTAPAVNKWENGKSFPDISLLSPLARLFNISVDTLLSHQEELSPDAASQLVEEALDKLKTESFEDVFRWMKECLALYPNSYFLALWMARIFESELLQNEESQDRDSSFLEYKSFIANCYLRVLECPDEELRRDAADSLYYFYVQSKDYEKAESFLSFLPQESPDRKRKQAWVFSKTDRQGEAYKAYEELLYDGYLNLSTTFHELYILALEERTQRIESPKNSGRFSDLAEAHFYTGKLQQLAKLFEFGEYHEAAPGLELAIQEENIEETVRIMEVLLGNTESIYGFASSPLYSHMEFTPPREEYFATIREDLREGLRGETSLSFLKDNPRWKALLSKSDTQNTHHKSNIS